MANQTRISWLPAASTIWFVTGSRILIVEDDEAIGAELVQALTIHGHDARLARSGRRRRLKISATWPWASAIITAWARISALAQGP